ncbi:SEC-C metal-binding domain-containing protein, partial [Anaerovibrio sp.]|uniref:SEC-C metal-binding domain-containing protein n=1 Tax=Anaerovibrio sp. TaxID=1872532 RepID=UPI003F1645B7
QLKMDNKPDTEELYQLIGAYNDSLPLWMLKGHTPAEAAGMPRPAVVREGRKIGRNEPCPCGSGKKYKNCCISKEWN